MGLLKERIREWYRMGANNVVEYEQVMVYL
jgi:hypothetical protein